MGINILHFQQTYYSITSLYAFIWDDNFSIPYDTKFKYHVFSFFKMFTNVSLRFFMIKLHNTGWAISHYLALPVTQY